MDRNLALMPWLRFCQSLLFWQATWFLFFQSQLSAAQAILLYAAYDITTTALEVPSGYMSDRLGRRRTLIAAAVATLAGSSVLAGGAGFGAMALGQALLGAGAAFVSGTDSAILYESLPAKDRARRIEAAELRLFRFGFIALGFSALSGGAMALADLRLPFAASAAAAAVMLILTLRLTEPPHSADLPEGAEIARVGVWSMIRASARQPVLRWLFVLGVLMYGYSHLSFVFGQPFIENAMNIMGLAASAPLISGAVSATMMLISVAASWGAQGLRGRLGLGPLVLLGFAIQIGIVAAMALSDAPWMIAVLLLRMVPDALSGPFIVARIQPLLSDQGRATWLSMKSLIARLLLSLSLMLTAVAGRGQGSMDQAQIAQALSGYVIAGLAALLLLLLTRPRDLDR